MRIRRLTLVKISFLLALCGSATDRSGASETFRFTRGSNRDGLSQVEITMQVGGDLRLTPAGAKQARKVPMSVLANLIYQERVLDVTNSSGRLAYRYYETAKAAIKIDKGGQTPQLSDTHKLVGVQRADNAETMFCPKGRLTREELDLIELPGSSLVVDDLLPADPVAVGGTWKADDRTLALLLGLEAVSFHEVQSTLIEVKDNRAVVTLGGTVGGAIGGVGTEMEIKAKYTFDLKQRRINWFALLIKEKRAVGHIGPGLDIVAKVIMKISPLAQSDRLNDEVLDKLPHTMSPQLKMLGYTAPKGEFRFAYDPRWFVTSEERDLVVLRMVNRGDLVAQCNISPIRSGAKTVTLADFQKDVERALGKSFAQFVQATEYTPRPGTRVYRLVARGEVSGLPIEWIYYLIAGQDGQRVSVSFTLETDLADEFGKADREIVDELQLSKPAVEAAAKPAPKKS